MNKFLLLLLLSLFFTASSFAQTKDTINVMVYNLLNFPDGDNSCSPNTLINSRHNQLKTVIDSTKPDVLMVCELQHGIGALTILNSSLNTSGRSYYDMAPFIPNNSGSSSLNNAFFYNTNKLGFLRQDQIITDLRDVNVYQAFAKDPGMGVGVDTVYIDFMMAHFKAGSTASNASRRARACDSVRKYIDTASIERNIILGGDFNMQNGTEAGFQTLLGGAYPLNDPLNMTGTWHNNASWGFMHTQSTRDNQTINCGAYGGLDDRFDLMLFSDPISTGNKYVNYLYGSYQAIGNNGSTYNKAINDPSNTTTVSTTVLDAMRELSDHLPVVMDVEVTYPSTIDVKKIAFADLEMLVFPNPANNQVAIQYSLPQSSAVTISLTDMLGRTVKTSALGLQSGKNIARLSLDGLPQGVYSIMLETEEYKQQKLLIKQ